MVNLITPGAQRNLSEAAHVWVMALSPASTVLLVAPHGQLPSGVELKKVYILPSEIMRALHLEGLGGTRLVTR